MMQLNSSLTVLIAERTPKVADAIARSLVHHGYRVVGVVNSAAAALEAAIIQVPDVVLIDVALSGELDGLATAQRIYEDLNCPVVYLSTLAQPLAAMDDTQLVPHYGSLVKPFTAEALEAEIMATLAADRDRRTQQANPAPLPVSVDWATLGWQDQNLLRLLALASQIIPMPRILFKGKTLRIFTETVDHARSLQTLCQQAELSYSYQIFTWHWQQQQYLPHDQIA